jgi:cytochrome c oxidase cbb3-type subunit III
MRPRLVGLLLFAVGCSEGQEARTPARDTLVVEPLGGVRLGDLVAGPGGPSTPIANPWANDKAALTQGRYLYQSFNCNGCHGDAGGGGIGPPLADDRWIYGGSDANIYATILQGRPNGMPAFGPQLSGEPLWKVAAYVRSLAAEHRSTGD